MAATEDLLDFEKTSLALDRLKKAGSEEQFKATFEDIVGKVGYQYFVLSGIPDQSEDLRKMIAVMKMPAAWEKSYFQNRYLEIDPVARHCLSSVRPFFWAEVMQGLEKNSPSYNMMIEAEKHGLTNGVCFPIHGINGYEAGVSLSGRDAQISTNDVRNLHMLSLYAFSHLKTIVKNSVLAVPALTRREKEVLVWTALGKTNKEIGELLFLSEETVATHVKKIIKKLSAQNKAEAVATAMRAGMIPG